MINLVKGGIIPPFCYLSIVSLHNFCFVRTFANFGIFVVSAFGGRLRVQNIGVCYIIFI
jgi:hypothetical protein